MSRRVSFTLVVCLSLCGLAPGDASNMGYDQAVAAFQQLLHGSTFDSDAHTPANVAVAVVADATGTLIITQTAERDMPDLFFHSSTVQTWTIRAADVDDKRIAVRTEPLSVYAPTKKNAQLIRVTRSETQNRIEGGHEPAEDWERHDSFMTSFVTIPVASVDAAEQAVALLKQIAKAAPETD